VVIFEDAIFGKPKDRAEAVATLQRITGNRHRVVTGVCLLSKANELAFADAADVEVAPMNLEEINYYVDNFNPYDKAGSYGIQEWVGLCKVHRIAGAYSTVMGLPMAALYKELTKFWSLSDKV
ncbi:MAG: Maf family protein, partial [Bacteroidota bacterium]